MVQTKRIHCVSDHEPASYHNTMAYAVNLNIECEGGVINASEAAAARKTFGHFLDALPRLEFHVYEVKAAAAGSEAHHIASLPAARPLPKVGTAAILAWLDGLNPDNQDSFWLLQLQTAAILDRKDKAIEQSQVKATHLLRGSHSWSAPVSHGFGLTRLLDAANIGDPTQRTLIILPHDPGFLPTSPVPVVDVGDERWDAKYAFDGALGDVVCRSNMLKKQVVTLPFLTPEGFLKVNRNAMELRRFLDAFERGWTGVVASLPTVLPRSVAYDKLVWTIAGSQSPNPGTGTFVPDVPAWRVITGLTVALDPMLIALLRPGSAGGDGVAGDLLLPLVNDVLDAAAEMPPEKLELTAGQVVGALRDMLRLSPLLKSSPTRKEFIGALRDVHGLGRMLDDTNAGSRLVDILLNAVADGVFDPLPWDEVKALAGSYSDKEGVKTATGFAQDPYDVVMDVVHKLHEEAGAEKAVLRLFASATAADGSTVPDLLWKALVPSPPADDADHAEFRRKLFAAWNAYGLRLEGSFNGEEAIRRSAGADFLDVLLRAAVTQHAEPAPTDLLALLEAADFFAVRIANQNAGVFGSIASTLPKPMLELLGTPAPDLKLGSSYADMLASLRQLGSTDAAFVADSAPAPLPIQVSASLGAGDLDKFSADFNGICIALRRIDNPKDLGVNAWSHANLAALSWKHGAHEGTTIGLRQWLPAVQDSRAPAFIDYEGFPFASRTIARVSASNVSSEAGRPFYEADVAEETEYDNNDWTPLPRLIYGRKFEAFSFATTNSGSLPKEIQQPNLPWMPKEKFAPVNAPLVKADYSRRTNIGTVSIDEGAAPARFGVAIAGVRPLAADYPRIALSACKGSGGSVDLLREPDGSGVLGFPAAGKELLVHLADFQWTGGRATVRVLFFDKAALIGKEKPVRLEFADFDPALLKKQAWMTLALRGDGKFHARLGSGVPQVATRAGAENSLWWIRIQLESNACTNIAFADPFARSGAQGGTPLLLMAPSQTTWKAGLSAKASARIASPRVGFLDFERWYGNPALLSRTFEDATRSGGRLLDWLLLAYVRRKELLKTESTENLSTALDRLPDPAVETLRVELVCLDTLNKVVPQVPTSLYIDLKKRLAAWGGNRTAEVENIKLPELRKMFEELAVEFSLKVEIESTGPALTLDQVSEGLWKVNVPAGVVAELRVSPLVPKVHFEEVDGHPRVIHAGIAQAAVRDGDWYVFPGDALRIETMLDGLAAVEPVELASRVISCRPQALVREYSVISDGSIADDEDRRRWRLVSDTAVSTQRWRPVGLPIYNMIDPRNWSDGVMQGAAVLLRNPGADIDDPLRVFENEIFLARAAEEAETVWKSIDPQVPRGGVAAPACTVLQSIPWEAPSATYMRHRFQLMSRYAGALKDSTRGTVFAWRTDEGVDVNGPDVWTRRVAMLADRSRVLVTRPQMRALLPLTTSPHQDGTPPIIAFLQESPFSEGGLADRVAADLKLGFGFGFSADGGAVGILDARKEFGRDPRIDYRRIPDAEALAIALATEGPVGLTFDTPRARAAAFSNSIISMALTSAEGKLLDRKYEEHFIGVSLRRYLAPEWLSDQSETLDAVPAMGCHWFELAPRKNTVEGMLEHAGNTVLRANENWFEVRTTAIDKGGNYAGVEWVAIAPHDKDWDYAVLHSPIAPGRYSAALFLTNKNGVPSAGLTNQPLLISNFEWSLPEETADTTVCAPSGKAFHCISSAPTFLAWSRTTRDFQMVPIEPQRLNGNDICEELRAEDLVARFDNNGYLHFETRFGESVTLQSSTARSKFPLHVHRHLAVIGTRVADGLGKPIHVFAGSAMVPPQAERFAPPNFGNPSQLHLIEYESPAKILGATYTVLPDKTWKLSRNIPAPYDTSYFDLVATDADLRNEKLRLFIRFISEAQKDKFASLGIRIEMPNEIESDVNGKQIIRSMDSDLIIPFQDRVALGAELLIGPVADNTATIEIALVYKDGGRELVKGLPRAISWKQDCRGFLLSLAATGEFWTDISMLHFSVGNMESVLDVSPFSFELLFSKASDLPPAEAVQAAALATMVEAQARIISISPPFDIM